MKETSVESTIKFPKVITITYNTSCHSVFISNGQETYDTPVADLFLKKTDLKWNPKTKLWELIDLGPDIYSYPAIGWLKSELEKLGKRVKVIDQYGKNRLSDVKGYLK
jgi:hypothetical protein